MKMIISSIVGLIALTTVMLAQTLDKQNAKKADVIAYIKRETIGGKLDFRYVLKNPSQVITDDNGVRFNKNDYYVLLWGRAVRDLGLESSDQAARLWEDIHAQKLTGPQRTALRIGFDKKMQ